MIWRIFATAFLVHAVVGGIALMHGYGFHRDEYYYLQCARHLSEGYVDHSAITPLIALLTGGQWVGVWLVTGLLYAGTVAMGAATARAFGGDARAQGLAAVLWGASPGLIAGSSLFGTVMVDQFASAALILAVASLKPRHGSPFPVLAASLFAAAVKPQGLILVVALAIVIFRDRRDLSVSMVLAALVGLCPMVIWQANADWPGLAFAQAMREDRDALPVYLLLAVFLAGPVGLVAAARTARGWPIALALGGIVVYAIVGGKPYYPFPFLLPLLADAAVRAREPKCWTQAALAFGLPVALMLWPLLPPSALRSPAMALNEVAAERVGWNEWVRQVETIVKATGATVVLTSNYGQAGALAGSSVTVLCGHNQHAFWPTQTLPRGQVALAVGYSEAWLRERFLSVKPQGTLRNGSNVANEEHDRPIFEVRDPIDPAQLARDLIHFN